jgi:peptide/nickel transport system permease protein
LVGALPSTTLPPRPKGARARLKQARTGFVGFWKVLRANPLTLAGFIVVVMIGVVAAIVLVAPHLITPYSPDQLSLDYNQPPSLQHPFGTDGVGIDILSETLYALPLDLALAFAIAGAAMLAGGGLGLVAGYWDKPGTISGAVSVVVMRITDIFLAFPSLILALAIAVSLGRGVWQLIVAILLTWWPYYVRLVRGETLAVKHLPYVMAAKAAGVTEGRIVLRHILRNVLEPVVVYFTLDVGTVLVTLSTIGFVGLGLAYPTQAEWGSMMSYYQNAGLITALPWTVLGPGLAIFVTVLAFSLLGDGLRDVLDPRSRRVLAGTGADSVSPANPPESASAPPEAEEEEESEESDLPPAPQLPGPTGG